MHHIGRWERVRLLSPSRLSAPFLLDRKWGQLVGSGDDDPAWVRGLDGLWRPSISGGAGFIGRRQHQRVKVGTAGTGGTAATYALDSNYAAGTGGDAYAVRVVLPETLTLNNIYFVISSYAGTAANVNDLNWEIRTGTAAIPTTTAPGLITSGTKDPASATGWINISGISQSLTANTVYWVIIGDADGGAGSDWAIVLRNHTMLFSQGGENYGTWPSSITANGYTTNPTVDVGVACVVLAFSDGSAWGNPFSTTANHGATTNRAGWYLSSGLTEQIKVFGMVTSAESTLSGLEAYDNATNPGGTTLTSSTTPLYSGTTLAGYQLASAYTMAKATGYRWVFTYGANPSHPRELQIGTGADDNLKAAMLGGASWYYALANGTTNWANDVVTSQPAAALLIEDQVAVSGGPVQLVNSGGLVG